jgi:hypothetical protein
MPGCPNCDKNLEDCVCPKTIPFQPIFEEKSWQCYNCKKIYAPWITECNCMKEVTWITYTTRDSKTDDDYFIIKFDNKEGLMGEWKETTTASSSSGSDIIYYRY